jgi:hypothetical protein
LRAAAEEAIVFRPKQGELGKSRLAQIARYVAATGQVRGSNNWYISVTSTGCYKRKRNTWKMHVISKL